MAGHIGISEGIGISMNSLSFDLITSEMRPYLTIDNHIIEELYESADIFILMDISELSNKDFMNFYSACFQSYEKFKELEKVRIPSWEEVLDKLREDPRFSKNET
ncbi:hypothetical protein [Cardiobacterium valvarum]|jgi:hypothetical protein|uniref:Uncharacterized protein n=1 Tax=Cardiobacterium valvarum TaxID=194702 RepID=A0A381E6E3_9GAMM|nr:hypothetical protein [Cardiobacterium valvarum]SUX21962.1 Uncharacterised protein [Cardiobacterium valvarum]